MKIVVVSGGFDPIHSGHLAYFREAKELGMYLIVGVNSDEWLMRKKGYVFMPIEEREEIVKSVKYVNGVNRFNDDDDSAIDLLNKVKYWYPSDEIIFVKGVEFVYGVGGKDKLNSSSDIVEKIRT
jgi:D-beta-D-heptose 7-phosphate kinase/D-beta-D-heptose 1-phosphate adenosyltransferase